MAQPRLDEGLNRRGVRRTAFDKADVVSQEAARVAVQEVPNLDRRQREYHGQSVAGHRPDRLNLVAVAFAGGPKAR